MLLCVLCASSSFAAPQTLYRDPATALIISGTDGTAPLKYRHGQLFSDGLAVDDSLAAKQPLDSDLTAIAGISTAAFGRNALAIVDAPSFRTYIGAGTSSFDGVFASLTGKPTTIAGYGITDFNSLGDARWSLLAHTHTFASLTAKPTTIAGYGITDPIVLTSGSYSDPTWITSLAYSKLTSVPAFPANTTSTTSQWFSSYNSTTGVFTKTQPTFTDLAAHPTTIAGYGITDFNSLGDARWQPLDTDLTSWAATTPPSSYAIGDLLYASAANTLSKLADVASGQPLLSGGVTAAPAYAGYTFSGTAARTYTFPTTTATLARTDAAQTFTGNQTFTGTANFNSGNGSVTIVPGDGTNSTYTGYVAWFKNNGATRLGYMGYDPTNISVNLENSAAFAVNGGHTIFEGVTSTGATGTGKIVYDTSPTFVTPALGTPASGVVTNLTGTAGININGTVGATTPAAGTFTTLVAGSTTSLLLGTAGSAVGNIGFRNATSGTATLAPPTGALGTYTVTLPNAASTLPVFGQQITFAGPTAARTVTFPDASFTAARTDAANTFTGVQTMTNAALTTPAIAGGTATGITGFALRDTSAAFDVTIAATSAATLTAGRTLTLDSGNVAHTLALGTTANTITFPNAASGTVPFLNLAQTWTALQSFGTNLGGTLQTAAQPNVTSLGTLTGLSLSGTMNVPTSAGTAVFAADASGGTTLSIANNATAFPFSATANNFAGFIIINDFSSSGSTALYLVGNTGCVLVSQSVPGVTGSFSATAATASRINVYIDGSSRVTIENKSGTDPINLKVYAVRMRSTL